MKKRTARLLDVWANVSLFTFGGSSIALTALGFTSLGAVAGLLSEPGFYYASWKSKSWAMWVLTTWWTGWWAYMLIKSL